MPQSPTELIKRWTEFVPRSDIGGVPPKTRGIYALLKKRGEHFDVAYVGLSAGTTQGIGARLIRHNKSQKKGTKWTHFSIFEVHDNIPKARIQELEGLFRLIYRKDSAANVLNVQKSSSLLKKVRIKKIESWKRAKGNA